MLSNYLELCLITNFQDTPLHLYKKFLLEAVAGGVTAVQLREKNRPLSYLRKTAHELKNILAPFNIPLIINDHIQIAIDVDAEGIHLGQSDLSTREARQRLGAKKLIGLSVETSQELVQANTNTDINYIAASAVFVSNSKSNCKTIWGLEGLRKIVKQSKHPVVAIGGIDASNIESVIAAGACGVAIISALHNENAQANAKILKLKIIKTQEKIYA